MSPSTTIDRAGVDQPTGIGWTVWVVAAALPWLWPVHGEPWAGFYPEALAAAAMLPIGVWAAVRARSGWPLDPMALAMMAIALVPLAQALLGMFVYRGEAGLLALYVGSVAVTAIVAWQAQNIEPWRLVEALLAALALAGLLSAGLTLYQWLEQDWLGILVHYRLLSGRAYANLGQPNNLATFLCWGVIAIWWGYHRRKLGGAVAALAIGFLLVGVVLTRSRTGWLEVALLTGVALYIRWRHRTGPGVISVLLLGAWFLVLTVGLEPLAHHVLREAPANLSDQSTAGLRPTIWKVALDEIAQRPLAGYGWNQSVPAYLSVAERHPEVRAVVSSAHNAVLDLLVWNGLPVGALILLTLAGWSLMQWRACRTQEQRLLLLALAVLALHALVELPHTYLFFMLPAAVFMGTLGAIAPSPPVIAIPRWIGGAIVVCLGAALVLAILDYQSIERDLQSAKLRAAGIHNPHPSPPPEPIVLGFLQTALVHLRTEPSRDLSAAQLVAMRQALDRYPLAWALFRYARASALSGRPDQAAWALERLCLLNSAERCGRAIRDWRELVAQGNSEMGAVELPPNR